MNSENPPMSPAVAAQQQAPMRAYAQAATGGQQGQTPPQAQGSEQLLGQLVDEAGKTLTKIAQVTQQTKPELIPILKQAVQALVMFAGKIKTGGGDQQQGAPQGDGQATASEGAPAAAGGSAMGMPQ